MSNFTPVLFIGVGETGAFFTLRETYLHEQWVGGQDGYMKKEVRSYHHFNLSQNADEAFAKAQEYAKSFMLKLNTTRESLDEEMREIKRSTAEVIAERVARAKAQEDLWAEQRAAEKAEREAKIKSGIFVGGPFSGKKFEEAPRGYLSWLMDTREDFEEGSTMRLVAESVFALVPHLALPKPNKTLLMGEVKVRQNFEATVVRVYEFTKPSFSGFGYERGCVTTMVTTEGACLVCFSGALYVEEGDVIKFKATVAKHDDYKGQAQTVIQRVTLAKGK